MRRYRPSERPASRSEPAVARTCSASLWRNATRRSARSSVARARNRLALDAASALSRSSSLRRSILSSRSPARCRAVAASAAAARAAASTISTRPCRSPAPGTGGGTSARASSRKPRLALNRPSNAPSREPASPLRAFSSSAANAPDDPGSTEFGTFGIAGSSMPSPAALEARLNNGPSSICSRARACMTAEAMRSRSCSARAQAVSAWRLASLARASASINPWRREARVESSARGSSGGLAPRTAWSSATSPANFSSSSLPSAAIRFSATAAASRSFEAASTSFSVSTRSSWVDFTVSLADSMAARAFATESAPGRFGSAPRGFPQMGHGSPGRLPPSRADT